MGGNYEESDSGGAQPETASASECIYDSTGKSDLLASLTSFGKAIEETTFKPSPLYPSPRPSSLGLKVSNNKGSSNQASLQQCTLTYEITSAYLYFGDGN